MPESWAASWAAEWAAGASGVQRFNMNHAPPGSSTGGEFSSGGSGGGAARGATGSKGGGGKGSAASGNAARKAQLLAQAKADRNQAHQLEAELKAAQHQTPKHA